MKFSVAADSDEVLSDASTTADSIDIKKCRGNHKQPEYKKKQKTEMCRNWEMNGFCRWGTKCSYAHGEDELVKKTHLPRNFMTRTCDTFHKDGFCSFGKRCQFMHAERDVYGEQSYETVLRENARLAKAKTTAIEDSNSQIYINVFERKTRLSCFVELEEEPEFTFDSADKDCSCDILSDDSDRLFEDFGVASKTQMIKMKSTKKAPKKKVVLQDLSKSASSGTLNKKTNKFSLKGAAIKPFTPSF